MTSHPGRVGVHGRVLASGRPSDGVGAANSCVRERYVLRQAGVVRLQRQIGAVRGGVVASPMLAHGPSAHGGRRRVTRELVQPRGVHCPRLGQGAHVWPRWGARAACAAGRRLRRRGAEVAARSCLRCGSAGNMSRLAFQVLTMLVADYPSPPIDLLCHAPLMRQTSTAPSSSSVRRVRLYFSRPSLRRAGSLDSLVCHRRSSISLSSSQLVFWSASARLGRSCLPSVPSHAQRLDAAIRLHVAYGLFTVAWCMGGPTICSALDCIARAVVRLIFASYPCARVCMCCFARRARSAILFAGAGRRSCHN